MEILGKVKPIGIWQIVALGVGALAYAYIDTAVTPYTEWHSIVVTLAGIGGAYAMDRYDVAPLIQNVVAGIGVAGLADWIEATVLPRVKA